MSSNYSQTASLALEHFYSRIFGTMEHLIQQHQGFGNWAIGGIPLLEPKPTQKALGLWYAEGRIPGFTVSAAVSLSLVPGDTRMGLFLPNECLLGEEDRSYLEELVSQSYNGKSADILVRDPDRVFFDRIFVGSPFDAHTLAEAQEKEKHPKAFLIAQRLSYMVIVLWTNAIRVIYTHGRTGSENFLVRSKEPITPEHVLGLPAAVLIQTNEMEVGDWISYIRSSGTPEQIKQHLESLSIPVLDVKLLEYGNQ